MKKKTTPSAEAEPRLFGIAQSNRLHSEMWGKNCFNSAFPAALACYMRSQGIKPVYVCAAAKSGRNLAVENRQISVSKVFGVPSRVSNEDLYFSFETKFSPYFPYLQDPAELDGADLVILHGDKCLRALQIKLTVVPDQTTSKKARDKWAPEIVLRPADTCSCSLGIYAGVADHASEVKDIFRASCADVQDWRNESEVSQRKEKLMKGVEKFLSTFHHLQKPYLLHPIWMTEGRQSVLAAQAFDIFVWSDYALITAYLQHAQKETSSEIHRASRAIARFARMQYELATSTDGIRVRRIYREMDFSKQTDKEFAMSGLRTIRYMTSPRRVAPTLPPDVLKHIILNGGHKMLSPERRFDQTVYFTASSIFK